MSESTKLSTSNIRLRGNQNTDIERTNSSGRIESHMSYGYVGENSGSHLLDYWRVIRKHIWLIIGVALLIPTLVAIVLVRKPDIYQAEARIQVDLENTNPLLGGMSKNSSVIVSSESGDPAYFNTQLQILTGPGLLRR